MMRGIFTNADGSIELTDEDGTVTRLIGDGAYEVARFYVSMKQVTKDREECPFCQLPMMPWEQLYHRDVSVGRFGHAHQSCVDAEMLKRHEAEQLREGR